MNKKYVVVMTSNYDLPIDVTGFDEYDKAKAYLHWIWEGYYNDVIVNNDDVLVNDCYHEDEYAQVVWGDGNKKTDFILCCVNEPLKVFNNVNWKRYL